MTPPHPRNTSTYLLDHHAFIPSLPRACLPSLFPTRGRQVTTPHARPLLYISLRSIALAKPRALLSTFSLSRSSARSRSTLLSPLSTLSSTSSLLRRPYAHRLAAKALLTGLLTRDSLITLRVSATLDSSATQTTLHQTTNSILFSDCFAPACSLDNNDDHGMWTQLRFACAAAPASASSTSLGPLRVCKQHPKLTHLAGFACR